MSSQALLLGYSRNFFPGAADFDGTVRMARGGGLTGAADSKSGIFSAWFRIDGGNGTNRYVQQVGTAGVGSPHLLDINNSFNIRWLNSAGTVILDILTSSHTSGPTWLNVLCSWDLAAGLSNLYINDVSDNVTLTITNDTIDYTVSDWFIGSSNFSDLNFNGCMAEYYFAPGQFLDFSSVANRRKFIDSSNSPAPLGATGSLPTGTAPLIYQHLDVGEAVANFATNRGTGGNFTITGTLTAASTSP